MMIKGSALLFHGADRNNENYTSASIERLTPRQIYTILTILLPICILGFIANAVVLWFICFRIKNRFSVYIQSLVVADIVILLYNFSFMISTLVRFNLNPIFSHIFRIVYLAAFDLGMYVLTVLSAERCLMLFLPLWYHSHHRKYLPLIFCVVLWIISCVIGLMMELSCSTSFHTEYSDILSNCKIASVFHLVINMVLFFPSMVTFTLVLFIGIKTKAKQSPPEKLDICIVAIVILFVIFGISLRMTEHISYWIHRIERRILILVFLILNTIQSTLTPFVYIAVGCWTRQQESNDLFLETTVDNENSIAS